MHTGTRLQTLAIVLAAGAVLAGCGGGGGGGGSPASPPAGSSPPPPPPVSPPPPPGPLAPGTCPERTTADGTLAGLVICRLPALIDSNLTLPKGNGIVYRISGLVSVGTEWNTPDTPYRIAALTIEPGARLYGDAVNDALVVRRGSRLQAFGTATEPVVFTSTENVLGTATSASAGQWGGVYLLGTSGGSSCSAGQDCNTIHPTLRAATGVEAAFSFGTTRAGVQRPAATTHILRHVRIAYAGEIPQTGAVTGRHAALTTGGSTVDASHVQILNSGSNAIDARETVFAGSNLAIVNARGTGAYMSDAASLSATYVVMVQGQPVTAGGPQQVFFENTWPRSSPKNLINLRNFTLVGTRTAANGNAATAIQMQVVAAAGQEQPTGILRHGVINGSNRCIEWATERTSAITVWDSLLLDCPVATVVPSYSGPPFGNLTIERLTVLPATLIGLLPGPRESSLPVGQIAPGPFHGAFSPSETTTQNWATGWTEGLF